MKKFFFIMALFVISIPSVHAIDTTIINPTYSMIEGSTIQDGSIIDSNIPILSNVTNRNQFCTDMGGTYISHTETIHTGDFARYQNAFSVWSQTTRNNRNAFDSITCDLPDNGNSNGNSFGLNANGAIGDGDLTLFVVNDGTIFIKKDNFLYMLVAVLVVSLLFRSVIFLFMTAVKTGMNLTGGKGLKINNK